jgi:hypothetical protein
MVSSVPGPLSHLGSAPGASGPTASAHENRPFSHVQLTCWFVVLHGNGTVQRMPGVAQVWPFVAATLDGHFESGCSTDMSISEGCAGELPPLHPTTSPTVARMRRGRMRDPRCDRRADARAAQLDAP